MLVVVGEKECWDRSSMTINYDRQGHFKLRCRTAGQRVGVHIFVPVPVPSLTRDFYPHGFLYPCQSLHLTTLALVVSFDINNLRRILSFASVDAEWDS